MFDNEIKNRYNLKDLNSVYMLTYTKRNKFIKKIILWSVVFGGLISLFIPTLATSQVVASENVDICGLGGSNGCISEVKDTKGLEGKEAIEKIAKVVGYVAKILVYIAVAISVIYIILGAWWMIVGLGDGPTYEKGLKTLKNAVLGLVVAMLAGWLINIIVGFVESLKK